MNGFATFTSLSAAFLRGNVSSELIAYVSTLILPIIPGNKLDKQICFPDISVSIGILRLLFPFSDEELSFGLFAIQCIIKICRSWQRQQGVPSIFEPVRFFSILIFCYLVIRYRELNRLVLKRLYWLTILNKAFSDWDVPDIPRRWRKISPDVNSCLSL